MRVVSPQRGGLIVAPDAAQAQFDAERPQAAGEAASEGLTVEDTGTSDGGAPGPGETRTDAGVDPTSFYVQFSLDPVRAIRQLDDILRNVVEHLSAATGSSVSISLEINARAQGFDDRTRRVVSENAQQLGARGQEFD